MSDSPELTEADDIDDSLIEDLNPEYHFPILRHNFHWITTFYKYRQFASDTCANNQARFIVKRAPVERRWFWLVEERLKTWDKAPESIDKRKALLMLAFEQCKSRRAETFWRERARIAGDDSVAESCIDADMTISKCIDDYGITQDDFVTANGSTLAVVPNQPAADHISAERQAANEAEQARLFGESRERTGLGGVSGGVSVDESGEDVDADGDVAMG
ncbi:hypothetical protein BELL_1024g00020 [Botrytis elliptica]|uniref:Uncharacterized protein n=1 Tax=Botrytis elliptica TaxID=278938 RepID=A0A4Z1IUD3_9HELO|nr:hypothetical protein EAE99_007924 [Botrytis elliptica]TGO64956.1 hypothetical protein BELL_1024g00020 [Botrytis elliptica]